MSLKQLMMIPKIANGVRVPAQVKQLWDVCQLPDFRKLTINAHVRLLQDIYRTLMMGVAACPMTSWRARLPGATIRAAMSMPCLHGLRTSVLGRIARLNSAGCLIPIIGRRRARAVKDRLSDALYEGLIARFVDRRTSKRIKGIGSGALMDASIKDDGSVFIDGHHIGQLDGLSFTRDAEASDLETKALEAAAVKAVTPEVDRRLTSLSSGQNAIFTLSDQGAILWGGMSVGRIVKSGSVFSPDVEVIGGDLGNPVLRQLAEDRMRDYLCAEVATHLAPLKKLKEMQDKPDVLAGSKKFTFLLLKHHGSLDRRQHGKAVRDVLPEERRDLRSVGVQFGQYNVYMPELTKPKPARLLSLLIAFGAGGDCKPFIPFAGVTSIPNDGDLKSDNFGRGALALAGYKAVGPRIVRFDILNRLATQIRDAQGQFEKIAVEKPKRPTFQIMSEMLALLGASFEEIQGVLSALGFQSITAEAPLEKPADPVLAPSEAAPNPPETITETQPSADVKPPDSAKPDEPKANSFLTAKPPKQPKRDRTRPALNAHVPREQLEDGTSRDVPNLEYWTLPSRPARGHRTGDNQKKGKGRRDAKDRRSKPSRQERQGGDYSAGKAPRPRKSIENSPFAALAALKGKPDNKKGDGS